MAITFEWSEDYSIGVAEIDHQHRRFIAFIDKVSKLEQGDADQAEILKLVRELEKYMVFHTRSEEFMMELYAYPKLQVQKIEHEKMLRDLKVKIEDVARQPERLNGLLSYLIDWLDNHLTNLDRDFGAYIKEQRGGLLTEPGIL